MLYELYVRFLVWLGAAPLANGERLLPEIKIKKNWINPRGFQAIRFGIRIGVITAIAAELVIHGSLFWSIIGGAALVGLLLGAMGGASIGLLIGAMLGLIDLNTVPAEQPEGIYQVLVVLIVILAAIVFGVIFVLIGTIVGFIITIPLAIMASIRGVIIGGLVVGIISTLIVIGTTHIDSEFFEDQQKLKYFSRAMIFVGLVSGIVSGAIGFASTIFLAHLTS